MKFSLLLLYTLLLAGIVAPVGMVAAQDGPIRHVVVFKYADDATDAQIAEITDAFRALQDKIPGILSFEYGVNNSPEGLDQDFTHVYVVTFEDAEAREVYLPHPEHQAFVQLLNESGILEEVFVVDYVPHE